MTSLLWADRAPTKCAALRRLLADGEFHSGEELRRVAGWRFSARLMELRTGEDGDVPLEVEKRCVGGDVAWEYRCVGQARVKRRPSLNLKDELYAENMELRSALNRACRRIAELEGRHG